MDGRKKAEKIEKREWGVERNQESYVAPSTHYNPPTHTNRAAPEHQQPAYIHAAYTILLLHYLLERIGPYEFQNDRQSKKTTLRIETRTVNS